MTCNAYKTKGARCKQACPTQWMFLVETLWQVLMLSTDHNRHTGNTCRVSLRAENPRLTPRKPKIRSWMKLLYINYYKCHLFKCL